MGLEPGDGAGLFVGWVLRPGAATSDTIAAHPLPIVCLIETAGTGWGLSPSNLARVGRRALCTSRRQRHSDIIATSDGQWHANSRLVLASATQDDPLLATTMAASIRSRIATGPEGGRPWRARARSSRRPISPEAGFARTIRRGR